MRSVPNDITRCAVPCELAPECQRAAPVPAGTIYGTAHFIGGRNCPGYLRHEACFTCALWKRDRAPDGPMPGVGPDYRVCGRRRLSPGVEWRAPTDWCQEWTV